jgi:hypothetical protein
MDSNEMQQNFSICKKYQKEGVLDYDVFCPKMFSGINDLNDVLETRVDLGERFEFYLSFIN